MIQPKSASFAVEGSPAHRGTLCTSVDLAAAVARRLPLLDGDPANPLAARVMAMAGGVSDLTPAQAGLILVALMMRANLSVDVMLEADAPSPASHQAEGTMIPL